MRNLEHIMKLCHIFCKVLNLQHKRTELSEEYNEGLKISHAHIFLLSCVMVVIFVFCLEVGYYDDSVY